VSTAGDGRAQPAAARPLWVPPSAGQTQMAAFAERTAAAWGGSGSLHAWSVNDLGAFWRAVWDATGVVGVPGELAFDAGDGSITGGRFFPDARLNFAENLLSTAADGSSPAIVFAGEDGTIRRVSWDGLRAEVAAMAGALRASGVGVGDRVAARCQTCPRRWRRCSPRRHRSGVLVDVGGLPCGRGGRPFRSDRPEGARRRRRLHLQRSTVRLLGSAGGDPRGFAVAGRHGRRRPPPR
jgi:hypothetical protein